MGKDFKEALRWSRLAAEQGHAWAQCRTAHILIRFGDKGEAEFREAIKWLILSYNQSEGEDERRHEFIKSDYEYLRSALPKPIFEAACKAVEINTHA